LTIPTEPIGSIPRPLHLIEAASKKGPDDPGLEPLYEEAIHRSEGQLAASGPFVVNTGKHTARAAADKFVVREQTTEDAVWWGQYNRPFNPESFSALHARLCGYLQGRDVFVQDVWGGADPDHRLAVRRGRGGARELDGRLPIEVDGCAPGGCLHTSDGSH